MGWRRRLGNDGRARILVALEPRAPDDQPLIGRSSPERKAIDPAIVDALEKGNAAIKTYVSTLKTENERLAAQLVAAEARANEESAKTRQAIAAVEKLEALLATERERADKAITGFEALRRLRTESDAFEQLAQRLGEMRPAWRRWLGYL
jgi:hypothetical protein